ncbi:MAG: T9SS C-terminal target domain-containing protein [Ignavibacteriae bacterium]|nr:MAG: T9SS C-terminal target domain-containing protein [Ignavibacteriota bacterium]
MKRGLNYILFLILSLVFYSFFSAPQSFGTGESFTSISDSSTYNKKYAGLPREIKYSIGLSPPEYYTLPEDNEITKSPYQNINISCDSFPQNEPSVKISRKNPDRVVAAWRDFRTGVEPANRKIGYSYSTDGGNTWQPSTLLLAYNPFYIFNSDPVVCTDTAGNFYISAISIDRNKTNSTVLVYKSTDEGVTFDDVYNVTPHPDSINYGDDKSFMTCDLVNGSPYINTLYAVWSSDSESVLSKSTNGGVNWSKRINIVPNGGGYALAAAVGPHGELYIVWLGMLNGHKYGLHVSMSTNGGLNFTTKFICPVASSLSFTRFPSIAVDVSGGKRTGNIYIVWSNKASSIEDEDVYFSVSSDKGESWSAPKRVNNDPLNSPRKQYWPSITVNGYGNIYITFYDTRNTNSNNTVEAYLARSTNGGNTFQNIPLANFHTEINYQNTDIRFGDYISIDSWKNKIIPVWTDERAGGYNMEIYSSVISDSTVGITTVSKDIPARFNLYQNYPNPFNPATTIKFDLPMPSFENVTIYNILGSEVSILVNEKLKEGTHTLNWDAANYPSGVYLYRVNFGIFIQTGKLLLVK